MIRRRRTRKMRGHTIKGGGAFPCGIRETAANASGENHEADKEKDGDRPDADATKEVGK